MKNVFVDQVFITKFGKLDKNLNEILIESGKQCLIDSNKKIDMLLVGSMNPEEFSDNSNISTLVADGLNIQGIPSLRIETASSSGAAIFSLGFNLIASGAYENILLIAGEKMTGLETKKVTKVLAKVIEENERKYGASMPSLAAMVTMAYKLKNNIPKELLEESMCKIAMKNHYNGSLNPLAHFKKAISAEEYLNSRMIAHPLRIYDCSPISDGGAAILLTSAKSDIQVIGSGQATDTVSLKNRVILNRFEATRLAAKKAYKMSGLTPKEICFAEVHDAFTSFEAINCEDLGFFDEGKSFINIINDETTLKGKIPINYSGGLKSRGHPVGASGLAQIADCVLQMRNQISKDRLIENNSTALCHSIGGMGNNIFVNILRKSAVHKNLPEAPEIKHTRISKISNSTELIADNEEIDGNLASYTTLYVTPEGFEPPLTLGIINSIKYKRIFARAIIESDFKIGQSVTVFKENGIIYFRKANPFDKVKSFIKRKIKTILNIFD